MQYDPVFTFSVKSIILDCAPIFLELQRLMIIQKILSSRLPRKYIKYVHFLNQINDHVQVFEVYLFHSLVSNE